MDDTKTSDDPFAANLHSGQPQTASDAGQSQDNIFDFDTASQLPQQEGSAAQPVAEAPATKEEVKTESKTDAELSPKDARHASKKINELVEGQYKLAIKMVQRDPDSIKDIAADDPKLAQRILDEYDFGVDTVDELLSKSSLKAKDSGDNEIEKLKEQILDEKVLRLQTTIPSLKDPDVLDEFKKLYKSQTYPDKTDEQLTAIAAAIAGKQTTSEKVSTEVLGAMLRAQGGMQTSVATQAAAEGSGLSEEDRKFFLHALGKDGLRVLEKRNKGLNEYLKQNKNF